ncbi:MAG: hypothetical protein JSV58_04385 [Candidatus Bathyarchaeota archaeon]|nr:MAG: hypothetical protein JSV58_04385 [Candidatus Bathyarchaeota archaeon]
MKAKHVVLASGIAVVVLASIILSLIFYQPPTPPATPSVHLIAYEWDIRSGRPTWEHEYVEVNVTLLNSGNTSAEFTLEVDLYDEGEYFTCQLWKVKLPAQHEETFTKTVPYELLISTHRPDAIRIIGGIYGDDDVLKEEYFREFSPRDEVD